MGNASLGNGCFFEPPERHQAIGIGSVAGWVIGFLRTSLHVRMEVVTEHQPYHVCCRNPGDGGLTRYVYIRYRLRLVLEGLGEAK